MIIAFIRFDSFWILLFALEFCSVFFLEKMTTFNHQHKSQNVAMRWEYSMFDSQMMRDTLSVALDSFKSIKCTDRRETYQLVTVFEFGTRQETKN